MSSGYQYTILSLSFPNRRTARDGASDSVEDRLNERDFGVLQTQDPLVNFPTGFFDLTHHHAVSHTDLSQPGAGQHGG